MLIGLVLDQPPQVLDMADDVAVGFKNVSANEVGDLGGEFAPVVDGNDHAHAVFFSDALIVLAESWRRVDHAGAFFGLNKVASHHPEGVEVIAVCKVGEKRFVATPDEVGTLDDPVFGRALEFLFV